MKCPVVADEKSLLRSRIRSLKREYSPDQLKSMSLPVIEKLLSHPKVVEADAVLMYHSLPDEVFTHDAIERLVAQGKRVYLPRVVSATEMEILRYGNDGLSKSALGILEPNGNASWQPADSIESEKGSLVAVIPGLAFDSQGNRLGRGKGYYDRFLSSHAHIYKIGICFPFQFVEWVPAEDNDIIMDCVISECG